MESGEAPKTAEPLTTPDSVEGQGVEIENAAKSLLGREIERVNAEFGNSEGSKENLVEIFPDPRERKMYLADHPEVLTRENLAKSNPLVVEHNGQMVRIKSIEKVGKDKDIYLCELEGVEGAVELPREVVKNAQLVSEAKDIFSLFSGEEKNAVKEYIKTLPNGENVIYDGTTKTAEQAQEPNKSADDIISEKLSLLEGKIKEAQKEGGRLSKEQQELLGILRLAKEANGEVGALLKEKALQSLKANGVLGIDNVIQSLSQQVKAAEGKLFEHLQNQNWSEEEISEFRSLVNEGQLEKIVKEGKFSEVKDLDKLLFGRKMTEEQLKKLLDPEDKKGLKGGSLLIALLFLLLGSMELAKQAVPMQNQ